MNRRERAVHELCIIEDNTACIEDVLRRRRERKQTVMYVLDNRSVTITQPQLPVVPRFDAITTTCSSLSNPVQQLTTGDQ
jgi:hypothetical protein